MLEANLDVIPVPERRRLESPQTFIGLYLNYLHAANLKAKPRKGYDSSQDTGRVLTLRPDAYPMYVCRSVEGVKNRGYFAWGDPVLGEQNGGDVVFKIFSPPRSVKLNTHPKQLEVAVALFALRLTQAGYELQPDSIEYLLP